MKLFDPRMQPYSHGYDEVGFEMNRSYLCRIEKPIPNEYDAFERNYIFIIKSKIFRHLKEFC